jgi:hypothetical protein
LDRASRSPKSVSADTIARRSLDRNLQEMFVG